MKIKDHIPVSVSLDQIYPSDQAEIKNDKRRILFISSLAVIIAACIAFIGKGLVLLINFFTNLSFHHSVSFRHASPATNDYGWMVIFIPAIGGLIVGLLALYGSRAIRGHGIPEAMEQILTNHSKIRPSITFLKPISAAVSIGTGGPFGSEGPIIATGGALGSTLGQLLKISAVERKILLAAGATAGMSAIFGSPIAAIFLAIELLLFEFSPRAIIPVALACITGSAGHHMLFENGAVFPSPPLEVPGNYALAVYSVIGLITGLIAAFVTKVVYVVEDSFEKLPIHWMWWPAIGGLVVGIIGYFAPHTLGVGYENITQLLSGTMTVNMIAVLCVMKFLSWSIALGSGTSGGTLAPLLTIGGAAGALLGIAAHHYFPNAGISISLAALTGMAALFAGSSRAVLTSIIFAIETTGQANALLPLLAACIASYVVSFFLMENTIMTEKIARRGVHTPTAYEPDVLSRTRIGDVLAESGMVISSDTTVSEATSFIRNKQEAAHNFYIVASEEGDFKGIVSASNLFSMHHSPDIKIERLIRRKPVALTDNDTLKAAVDMMVQENVDEIPVVSSASRKLLGILSYRDIFSGYRQVARENNESVAISLKRRTLRMVVHGRNKISTLRVK